MMTSYHVISNKKVQRRPIKVKATAWKLIFINKNPKLTNFEKHACQNDIAMATSSTQPPPPPSSLDWVKNTSQGNVIPPPPPLLEGISSWMLDQVLQFQTPSRGHYVFPRQDPQPCSLRAILPDVPRKLKWVSLHPGEQIGIQSD